MKKIKFYLFSIILLFLIVEILSFFVLKIIYTSSFIKYHQETISFKSKYKNNKVKNFIPYIDHRKNLEFLSTKPNLYYEDESFLKFKNSENKKLILFQGDSWGEIARYNNEMINLLKSFELNNNIEILNTSTGSFSLSTVLVQLKILKTYLKIEPKIIVLMIDQTDLGDDLYRRQYYYGLPSNDKIYFSQNIINIGINNNLNFNKIIQLLCNYYLYYKKIYNFTHLQNISFFIKKLRAYISGSYIQLDPLKYGINYQESFFFKDLLGLYYELAYESDKLEKIIIVTHPHKKHLSGDYNTNLSLLVDQFINTNNLNEKIIHLDFLKKIKETNIKNIIELYAKNDEFSHLTYAGSLNWYFPAILKEIKNLLSD
tara:strand:- start:180 stop:1292 length:1113 start_codon:yes stop_codon:yes gene_type:complete